jgi:uncharacterized phage-like protein YoqJ
MQRIAIANLKFKVIEPIKIQESSDEEDEQSEFSKDFSVVKAVDMAESSEEKSQNQGFCTPKKKGFIINVNPDKKICKNTDTLTKTETQTTEFSTVKKAFKIKK